MALTRRLIREDVARALGEDPDEPGDAWEFGDEENLLDLGLDSVRLMSLIARWRREHDVEVSFADLAERPSVAAWAALLVEAPS
ncbi:phosphopantetheine-binding protein [Streptomyces hoynatensis]|uniref:Isochorismatase n=1 Tax=Streptomyces hoynatensis TaxID=1141874 RepID=A0A3A9YT85_9ACTN|nr:phosphopantetheine-binding protein [Streptomyces hoynatensis]RKN38999.1 isochorismatase [Streptomyces hoynatensis]